MKIEKIVVGYLEENCYVLIKDNKALVIDPGAEIDKIQEVIGDYEVIGVLITHYHLDHVGALSYFAKSLIYDRYNLEEKEHCIGPFKFKVIYTPGHSSDSISYYFEEEKILFDGDFIFYDGIGRCDMGTSDPDKMVMSIEKIAKYPQDIVLYPGHGKSTTLGREFENNKYLQDYK